MSSTPQYLKCFECKTNPSQFTFLNCNHIYCSDCFLVKVEKYKKYSLIRCSCGGITYFNDDNEIIQSFKLSNISKQFSKTSQRQFKPKQIKTNTKQFQQNEALHNLQLSSIVDFDRKSRERDIFQRKINTQKNKILKSQQYNGNQNQAIQKEYSNIRRTTFDNSHQSESQKYRSKNYINQFSTHNIYEKQSKKSIQAMQKQKQKYFFYKKMHNHKTSSKNQSSIHEQFKSQMQFLNILYEKEILEVQQKFKKILQGFSDQFKKLQKQLRSLYLENILTKQFCSIMNLSLLFKDKYYSAIGNKIKLLKDQLFITHRAHFNQSLHKKVLLQEEKNTRVTVKQQNLIQASNNYQKLLCKQFNIVKEEPYNQQNYHRSRIKNQKFLKQKQERQPISSISQILKNNERVQTEHLHTHIKRPKSSKFYQRPTNGNFQLESEAQFDCSNRSHLLENQNFQNSDKNRLRKHIIYYSPPLPYCYRHYQKKSRQAKNYINQIENLCKAKKLKNSKDLFKKFRNQKHDFSYRFQ